MRSFFSTSFSYTGTASLGGPGHDPQTGPMKNGKFLKVVAQFLEGLRENGLGLQAYLIFRSTCIGMREQQQRQRQ